VAIFDEIDMKHLTTTVAAAALIALNPWPLDAVAQDHKAPGANADAASAVVGKPTVVGRSPTDWIQYEDATFTPVLDDVSRNLAAARAALANKDNTSAADSMQAASRALQVQADRAAKIERERAAGDMALARETRTRMEALVRQLDATAAHIKAGKVVTVAQLDKTLGKAARADLERRWLVTDVTTWYPVVDEPQRHFGAAVEDFAKKDFKAAAAEVREASAYVRLESVRAIGDAKKGLESARTGLDETALALDRGAVKSEQDLTRVFARAEQALAVAHRAKAAESWARKAYETTGYEMKAAAQDLEAASSWTEAELKTGATQAAVDARVIGDKLASGGVWAKDEVSKGFESLATSLNKLGHSIGSKSKAAPFDVGAG
jgi:hypothetical protein